MPRAGLDAASAVGHWQAMEDSKKSSHVELRPATAGDWPVIADIAESAYWSNFESLEPGAGEAAGYRQRVREMFEIDGRKLWSHGVIAECEGKPVGWGVRDVAMGWVRELWIAADFQGRGIGRVMLERFVAEIARRGHDFAFIDTHARNEGAIRLYESAGFVREKRETRWSIGLQRQIPIIVLVKPLTSRPNRGSRMAS
jgi:ribosomal-protein-alanine N-acetyltransferase